MEEPTSEQAELLKGMVAIRQSHTTAADLQTSRGKKLMTTTTPTPVSALLVVSTKELCDVQLGDCTS